VTIWKSVTAGCRSGQREERTSHEAQPPGVGGMSAVESACLTLLIIMVGWAAISVWTMVGRIQAEDVASALIWGGMFLAASLVGAWCFWRLV
jgi:hypothetical protein